MLEPALPPRVASAFCDKDEGDTSWRRKTFSAALYYTAECVTYSVTQS